MSIDDYIESLTSIHKDNRTNRVKLFPKQSPNKNQFNPLEKETLTYNPEFGNSLYNTSHEFDLKSSTESNESKIKTTNDRASPWRNLSIKPRIGKAINLERDNNFKKHFKEFQQQSIEVATEYGSSESEELYITVSSETESSYFTAIEDFTELKKASDNLESEISFDSGIDEGKRDLITRLLQSKGEDFLSEEEFLTDSPVNSLDTQDLLDDIEIEQRYWNEDISEHIMYEERISRFFQTTDPHNPVQYKISVNKSSRQYFMNLSDEHFSEFEIRKSSNSISLETSL